MSLRDDIHFSSLAVGRYTEYPVTRVIRQTAVTRLNDFSRCSLVYIRDLKERECIQGSGISHMAISYVPKVKPPKNITSSWKVQVPVLYHNHAHILFAKCS